MHGSTLAGSVSINHCLACPCGVSGSRRISSSVTFASFCVIMTSLGRSSQATMSMVGIKLERIGVGGGLCDCVGAEVVNAGVSDGTTDSDPGGTVLGVIEIVGSAVGGIVSDDTGANVGLIDVAGVDVGAIVCNDTGATLGLVDVTVGVDVGVVVVCST